jgi:hypothetical protein
MGLISGVLFHTTDEAGAGEHTAVSSLSVVCFPTPLTKQMPAFRPNAGEGGPVSTRGVQVELMSENECS